MPAKVTTGISAFLSACSQITRPSPTPFTRASLTYSESSTSSMPERSRRMRPATTNQPRVKPGKDVAREAVEAARGQPLQAAGHELHEQDGHPERRERLPQHRHDL